MEAKTHQHPGWSIDFTPVTAILAGDVVQLPDGRAAYCPSALAAGQKGAAQVAGVIKVEKTASIALLEGGDVYWDVSAAKAHFRPESGSKDFYLGTVHVDAAGADTHVYVVLNNRGQYTIDLERGGEWTAAATAGTTPAGTQMPGGNSQIVLANTNEAQGYAISSNHAVLGSAKPILEARVAQYSASGSTVDIDFGLANGVHASDFESVTHFAAFHQDGGDVNIDTHSDDNSTDRALADSTLDLVDDTYHEYWIDARDDTDVKFYVDGVLVDTSSAKRILTGALATALKAVIEVEKSTGTETAEVRVSRLRVRTQTE